ncbi:MAG TPA: hypothetical protein VG735_07905 [Caulobacterales bacterium]|nr:hypothetical protein [Caulobacterales bacterium]
MTLAEFNRALANIKRAMQQPIYLTQADALGAEYECAKTRYRLRSLRSVSDAFVRAQVRAVSDRWLGA